MKHYKSVYFLSIFRNSSPPAETQSPPIEENFLATVLLLLPQKKVIESITVTTSKTLNTFKQDKTYTG